MKRHSIPFLLALVSSPVALWIGAASAGAEPLTEQQILDGAAERIERCRKGDVVLRLIGPDGAAVPIGTGVAIQQTGHEFLFGCNIFWLFNCGESGFVRKPAKADAYGRAFADLFNYATVPFYWGVPLHWTEATIISGRQDRELAKRDRNPQWPSTPEGEARQARDVVWFYTTLFSHPAVEAITWWDFSDEQAWKNAPSGLLKADMIPKPAYLELHKRIKGAWWTKATAKTTTGGEARLRGFYGDYKVAATVSGKRFVGVFHFNKRPRGTVEVRLVPETDR